MRTENTDYHALIRTQRDFFFGGQSREISFRRQALEMLEQELLRRRAQLFAAVREDHAANESDFMRCEFDPCLAEIRLCRKKLRSWIKPLRGRPSEGFALKASGRREARGCVLIISPWCQPLYYTLVPLIDAIAAGNCVLIKASEYASHFAAELDALCQTIFPPQYVAVLQGPGSLGAALAEAAFDFIFFSGNALNGREIMQSASRRLTPVSLHTGGKNPCIVTAVADPVRAANAIIQGKMRNMGQRCGAVDYVLVQEQARDSFIEALCAGIRAEYGVDPLAMPEYRPVVNRPHFERLLSLLEDSRIVWGGRSDANALKIEPTVLEPLNWRSPVMQQEIYGPILPVLTYDRLVPTVEFLNRLPHPLNVFLFSDSAREQRLVDRHLICSSCFLNTCVPAETVRGLHRSGVGMSGFGDYGGKRGFELFSRHHNTYCERSSRRHFGGDVYDEEFES